MQLCDPSLNDDDDDDDEYENEHKNDRDENDADTYLSPPSTSKLRNPGRLGGFPNFTTFYFFSRPSESQNISTRKLAIEVTV